MRRTMTLLGVLVIGLWATSDVHKASAFPAHAREAKVACATCHANVAGGAELTEVGKKYKADATVALPKDVKGADYVGTNKCKMCHAKEYKAWATTKHGMAWATLQKADDKTIAEVAGKVGAKVEGKADAAEACIGCHVVGFKLTGGYPQADSAKAAGVVNVGCEDCHGPGSMHVAAKADVRKQFINRAVGENLCKQCHLAALSPKFAFAEMKKTIHPVAAATPAAK